MNLLIADLAPPVGDDATPPPPAGSHGTAASPSLLEAPPPANPFVGPVPLVEGQPLHGRDRAVRELAELLTSKRIVLLISPSGAGKTSLVQAGLLPWLKSRPRSRLQCEPVLRVRPDAGDRADNPYVFSVLRRLETGRADPLDERLLRRMTLVEYARQRLTAGSRTLHLLVFDQFEELFTLNGGDWPAKREFLRQLGEMLGGRPVAAHHDLDAADADDEAVHGGCQIWALFSMREDHLAELDPYHYLFPTGLSFRYRLMPLEREAAIEVVQGPAEGWIDADAAAALVDDLRVGGARPVARPGDGPGPGGAFVEAELDSVVGLASTEGPRPEGGGEATADRAAGEPDAAFEPAPDEETPDAARAAADALAGAERYVEPMLLQVSALRLWEDIVAGQARRIHREDIRASGRHGAIDAVLADFIDTAVATAVKAAGGDAGLQRTLRDWLEGQLLTRTRRRSRVLREEGGPAGLAAALAVLEDQHLVHAEQNGDRTWYELSHDRLVDPLVASNRRWRDHALNLFQRQAELWDQGGRAPDFLIQGRELRKADAFAHEAPDQLMPLDRAFLHASHVARRWRLTRIAFAAACLGLAVLASFALYRARQAQSRVALMQAVASSRDSRGDGALERIADVVARIDGQRPVDETLARDADLALMQVLGRQPPAIRSFSAHANIVHALAFAPDGLTVFSGGWDHVVEALPVDAGDRRAPVPLAHMANIYAITTHPGRRLMAATDGQGELRLWRVDGPLATGLGSVRVKATSSKPEARASVMSATFDRDGRRLVISTYDGRVLVGDVGADPDPKAPATWRPIGERRHRTVVSQVLRVPSSDGRDLVASADWDGNVFLWDLAAGTDGTRVPVRQLRLKRTGSDVAIRSLAVTPNGRWLLAGDNNGVIRTWNLAAPPASTLVDGVQRAQRLHDSQGHRAMVTAMAVSDDGRVLVSVGADEMLLRWTLDPGADDIDALRESLGLRGLAGWDEKLYSVAFVPGRDDIVAVGGNQRVRLVDTTRSSALVDRLPQVRGRALTDRIPPVASADVRVVAAVTSDGAGLQRWTTARGQLVVDGQAYPVGERIADLALSPDGRRVAWRTCAGEVNVRAWADWARPAAGSATAPATAGAGDAAAPGRNARPSGCARGRLLFLPDSRRLVDAADRDVALLVPDATGRWVRQPSLGTTDGPVAALAADAGGTRIAAGGRFEHLRLWTLDASGAALAQRDSASIGESTVNTIAFTPDGHTLVVGGEDGRLTTWSAEDLVLRADNDQHHSGVTALSVGHRHGSPLLISADRDGQLMLCSGDIAPEHCMTIARLLTPVTALVGSLDGDRLLLGADAPYAIDLRHDRLLARAASRPAR